jgi:hypothetical protein
MTRNQSNEAGEIYDSNDFRNFSFDWSLPWDPGLPGSGFRVCRSSEKYTEAAHEGIGVIEAAVFALLGLLLGFSFSGGTSRMDTKRQLIVQEANAIGTAYLRLTNFRQASNRKCVAYSGSTWTRD